jgi:hypothetical protein
MGASKAYYGHSMIFQDISSGTLLQWDTKTKLKYEKDEIINFTYDELDQVTPMDLFNEDEKRVAISNPRKVQSLDLLLGRNPVQTRTDYFFVTSVRTIGDKSYVVLVDSYLDQALFETEERESFKKGNVVKLRYKQTTSATEADVTEEDLQHVVYYLVDVEVKYNVSNERNVKLKDRR